MNERKLSELQKEYRNFFLEKMRLYGVKSPAELSKEKKSLFFTEIKWGWAEEIQKKLELKYNEYLNIKQVAEKPIEVFRKKTSKENNINQEVTELTNDEHNNNNNDKEEVKKSVSKTKQTQEIETLQETKKQVIKSEPNPEQTNDLRILFTPNNNFEQDEDYLYPVVKMPKQNSLLKLPRNGRSNQKGYKEDDFYNQIQVEFPTIESTNNVHLIIPNYNKPYEPDIVLFDKNINLFIDIEIDEPYDGYFRFPTHYIHPEQEVKQDNIRDLFFTESGWVVIRFTEKQVHCQPTECLIYIKEILNSIYNRIFSSEIKCDTENQWDYNQCIQWQKSHYREKYLGIDGFKKRINYKEIEINAEESESIETLIERTKLFQFDNWNSNIAFDEETHKYIHPNDETGNAEYNSVTTLIERFFPFDLKRYIEKEANEKARMEEDVLDEYLTNRDEAAEKGTFLHKQIENYLKGVEYESKFVEFQLFLDFYEKEIKKRNLIFFEAEKMIFSNKYNVAGTIDCLFKKNQSNEYVMLDWKRSKKLIVDGRPIIYGYGFALSELIYLDNSSYYRYCLQQNIYKFLLETEYSIKISSMRLVVLHENYSNYHIVRVPEMAKEVKIILDSLKHKI